MKEQMYIITAVCWKCNNTMSVAMIESVPEKRNGFCGPEAFTTDEKKIAETHGVVLRDQHSYTREETYCANTCPHCNTFIGQHYLFTDYFVSSQNGDYEYKTIDLV